MATTQGGNSIMTPASQSTSQLRWEWLNFAPVASKKLKPPLLLN
jgi:hypothetical protein